jgi:valyl-tRNA synthetase
LRGARLSSYLDAGADAIMPCAVQCGGPCGSLRRLHKHLHGRCVRHPFVDRRIPIITDAILVDPKFGTGAVKVTPAHDFNDFATGKRHGLEELTILDLKGTMNEKAGPFAGMDRFAARKAVKRALEERGLARGSKQHELVADGDRRFPPR